MPLSRRCEMLQQYSTPFFGVACKPKLAIQTFFAIVVLAASIAAETSPESLPLPGENRFLSNIRQLTYDGKRAGEGYFSEDGNALIFQSERELDNPFYQIYVLNLLTGDTHRVSPGVGKTTCAFFRPGTDEVLYASTHHDAFAKAKQEEELKFRASGKERRYSWDYDAAMDIFSAKRDGSNLKQLTSTPGYDAEASYSPDGKHIVFCSLRDAYPKSQLSAKELKQLEVEPAYFGEIYLMNADGSDQKRLTDWPGYDGGPFFTPDGQHIVWRHFTPDGSQADIYTMRLDGSGVRRLTDFDSMSWAPYFHPSGAYVIFASNKLGFSNFELYLVDAWGRHEPVRVTSTDGFDGLPVFSPDGNSLCWTSQRNSQGVSQLYLAAWNHQAAVEAITAAPESQNTHTLDSAGGVSNLEFSNAAGTSIRHHVEFLADDALEGRMTGSEGAKRAADYIADQFQHLNLNPLEESRSGDGDYGQTNERSYFQTFEFTAGRQIIPEENKFHITRQMDGSEQILEFSVEQDFQPLSFSRNGVVEGEVMFVGYGLSVPGELGEGYDAYAGLDVKDKIVVALRYVPEEVEPKRRQQLNRYAGLRYKAMQAREQGAKAFLVVAGPNSPNAGELIPLDFDSSLADSGIVAASISDTVANALFAPSSKTLKAVQSGLDVENPHFVGQFPLPDVKIKIAVSIEKVKKTDKNVIAMLAPAHLTDEPGAAASIEYIIVGAHYDHIGYGEIGSLARKSEEGQIHNGADDNASGTAVILELATTLSEAYQEHPEKFRRGIVFALWSGEELGLIGSTHFVNYPVVPLENVAAYINFDMVGRLRENNLILQGVGSSSVWTKLIEKRNIPSGFNLTLQTDPYLPTDVTAFYPKEVPVLSFFTGGHEDYNRPTDDPGTLNYDGIERIAGLAHGIILDLITAAERPEYVRVERSQAESGSRDTLRAYLGTIPDYTTEGAGVKLSGVRAGGPADKAGLKGGDVIVEFGGQQITNIYDYTYALDAVKIGEPVEVIVMRHGNRMTLTVTPEARN